MENEGKNKRNKQQLSGTTLPLIYLSHNRLREHSRTYISPETARFKPLKWFFVDLRSKSKILNMMHKALHNLMPADFSSFVTHDFPFTQSILQLSLELNVPKQVLLYSSLNFCTCMATQQLLKSSIVFQSTDSRILLPALNPCYGQVSDPLSLHLFSCKTGQAMGVHQGSSGRPGTK